MKYTIDTDGKNPKSFDCLLTHLSEQTKDSLKEMQQAFLNKAFMLQYMHGSKELDEQIRIVGLQTRLMEIRQIFDVFVNDATKGESSEKV